MATIRIATSSGKYIARVISTVSTAAATRRHPISTPAFRAQPSKKNSTQLPDYLQHGDEYDADCKHPSAHKKEAYTGFPSLRDLVPIGKEREENRKRERCSPRDSPHSYEALDRALAYQQNYAFPKPFDALTGPKHTKTAHCENQQ